MTQASSISLPGSKASYWEKSVNPLSLLESLIPFADHLRPLAESYWESSSSGGFQSTNQQDFTYPCFMRSSWKARRIRKLKSSYVWTNVSPNKSKARSGLAHLEGVGKPSLVSAVRQQPSAVLWSEREGKAKMWDALTRSPHERRRG